LKTIGILGGMSAASTQIYYRELCRLTAEKLGGLHSPDLLIRSMDFAGIEALQAVGAWGEAGERLAEEARALERGGAELLMLATNTMHKVAQRIVEAVSIPFLHIADATASRIASAGLHSPGLMATAFTMEQSFYTSRLAAAGLTVVLPNEADRAETHRVIYDELCRNIVHESSRQTYIAIAHRLIDGGADCLVLGCTEIGMLLRQEDLAVPVFDTALVHCAAALDLAIEGDVRAHAHGA